MQKKEELSLDPNLVSSMKIQLAKVSELFGTPLRAQTIASQVADNLTEWGYTISAVEGNDYSHSLTVVIGSVKQDSTPAGFSFTPGNSDPRAIEFQKAETLPITCSLIPFDQPEQSAELTLLVMADDYIHHAEHSTGQTKLTKLLVNDMSTACFNLLSHLKVKTRSQKNPENAAKPGWIPEIRMEVENDAEPEQSDLAPTNAIRDKNESRKRIIIHNQGSPVIFNFGHERK